jgi:hypothetical protein
MKKYNQRRSSKIMNAFRKDLQQCEHKIQASVSAFLACIKEALHLKQELTANKQGIYF